jgi:hypothetical protein
MPTQEQSPFPDAEVTKADTGGGETPRSSAAPPGFRERRGSPPSADAEERERMPTTETTRSGGG